MNKNLTVFLCSTFADLVSERAAVLDAVRKLQLLHDSMEFFGARPGLPIETCLAEVSRSNIVIVIVGHRYGSLVPTLGVSFSEAEYEEGFRLGKPCLIYMLDDNVPVLPRNIERDPENMRKLERWKTILHERHTVATFTDGQGLAVQVTADLARTLQSIEASDVIMSTNDSEVSDIEALFKEAHASGISRERLVSTLRQFVRSLAPEQNERVPLVFFSYARADSQLVSLLADRLRAASIDVWRDDTIGDSVVQIRKGLDSADFVVFVASKNSINSVWVQTEVNVALVRQISGDVGASLLPIIIDDVELPPLLRTLKYLDLRNEDMEKAADLLLSTIEAQWGMLQRAESHETRFRAGTFRVFLNIMIGGAGSIESVTRGLFEIPDVIEVTTTYGAVDIVAVIGVNDIKRVKSVVEIVSRIEGVDSVQTLIGTSQERSSIPRQ